MFKHATNIISLHVECESDVRFMFRYTREYSSGDMYMAQSFQRRRMALWIGTLKRNCYYGTEMGGIFTRYFAPTIARLQKLVDQVWW